MDISTTNLIHNSKRIGYKCNIHRQNLTKNYCINNLICQPNMNEIICTCFMGSTNYPYCKQGIELFELKLLCNPGPCKPTYK